MAGLQALSCVKSQVPPSISFQSLSVKPQEYDPGLAALTIRLYPAGEIRGSRQVRHRTGTWRRRRSDSQSGGESSCCGEVRLVHSSASLQSAVMAAITDTWPTLTLTPTVLQSNVEPVKPKKKEADDKSAEDGEDQPLKAGEPESEANKAGKERCGVWCCPLGPDVSDADTRYKLLMKLFHNVSDLSWDIVSAANLTDQSSSYLVCEMTSWILKKQCVAIPGSASCGILLSSTANESDHSLKVITPQQKPEVEVNNLVRSCLETHTSPKASGDRPAGRSALKSSESGYISEEEKTKLQVRSDESKYVPVVQSGTPDKSPARNVDIKEQSSSTTPGSEARSPAPEGATEATDDAKDAKSDEKKDVENDAQTKDEPSQTQVEDNQVAKDAIREQKDEEKKDEEAINPDVSKKEENQTEEKSDSSATASNDNAPCDEKNISEAPKSSENSNEAQPSTASDGQASGAVDKAVEVVSAKATCNIGQKESVDDGQQSKSNSPAKKKIESTRSHLANILGGGSGLAQPAKYKELHPDPDCPADFKTSMSLPNLLLELVYKMFSHKWKLTAAINVQGTEDCILLFRHDARILPGLGQQVLSGFAIHNRKESAENVGKGESTLQPSESSIGKLEILNTNPVKMQLIVKDLQLGESKGNSFNVDQGMESAVLPHMVFSFSNHSLSLYNTIQTNEMSLLMFRESNISSSQHLTIILGPSNWITLLGGSEAEITALRKVISGRWPYPIAIDRPKGEFSTDAQQQQANPSDKETAGAGAGAEKAEEAGDVEDQDSNKCWEWKVRRYPWRVSYGARLIDRAVQTAAKILPSIPPPQHQDLESAKSIVIFSVKELAELGWKFCGSIHANQATYLYFLK